MVLALSSGPFNFVMESDTFLRAVFAFVALRLKFVIDLELEINFDEFLKLFLSLYPSLENNILSPYPKYFQRPHFALILQES